MNLKFNCRVCKVTVHVAFVLFSIWHAGAFTLAQSSPQVDTACGTGSVVVAGIVTYILPPKRAALNPACSNPNEDPGPAVTWNQDFIIRSKPPSATRTPMTLVGTSATRVTLRILKLTRKESITGALFTYVLVIENLSTSDDAVSAFITDILPHDLAYIPGSSTLAGAPHRDPVIQGQRLTWTGLNISAHGALPFTYSVRAKVSTQSGGPAAVSYRAAVVHAPASTSNVTWVSCNDCSGSQR